MICVGVEDHVGVGVEAVVIANLPHLGPIQIWLGNAKNHQQGHKTRQFNTHQIRNGSSGRLRPFPVEDAVRSVCHFGDVEISVQRNPARHFRIAMERSAEN